MGKTIEAELKKKVCGIVMPISDYDGCSSGHWADVLRIISSAATDAGLSARLVSETMESNLIHKEILGNIYNDDLVIVDVSGCNPNVFFELGVRMATQKPTVIVKDNVTVYPFDTAPNRFIEYPRDLRHPAMEAFKTSLKLAMLKTIDHLPENSFIGQLGPFHVPKIEEKEVSISDAILEKLENLEQRFASFYYSNPREWLNLDKVIPLDISNISASYSRDGIVRMLVRDTNISSVRTAVSSFNRTENAINDIRVTQSSDRDFLIEFPVDSFRVATVKVVKLAGLLDDIPF